MLLVARFIHILMHCLSYVFSLPAFPTVWLVPPFCCLHPKQFFAEAEQNNKAYIRDLADIMRSYIHVRMDRSIWNAVLAAFSNAKDAAGAEQLYQRMVASGIEGDEVTFDCFI